MNSETREAAFNFRKDNPEFWYQKSVSLYASAAIIWDARQRPVNNELIADLELKGSFAIDEGCEHQYLMLMGQAYEVLLKAICITCDKTAPENKHDLNVIAQMVGIELSKREKKLLNLLSDFITWEGRYPTPKKPRQMEQHWTSTRKNLFQKVDILGRAISKASDASGIIFTVRTDIFEHETLKAFWLKLQDKYWKNAHK